MDNINNSLILNFNNAKVQIIGIINKLYSDGVPYYFIEPFLSDIASQVHKNAIEELKLAQTNCDEQVIEEDNTSEENKAEE